MADAGIRDAVVGIVIVLTAEDVFGLITESLQLLMSVSVYVVTRGVYLGKQLAHALFNRLDGTSKTASNRTSNNECSYQRH